MDLFISICITCAKNNIMPNYLIINNIGDNIGNYVVGKYLPVSGLIGKNVIYGQLVTTKLECSY